MKRVFKYDRALGRVVEVPTTAALDAIFAGVEPTPPPMAMIDLANMFSAGLDSQPVVQATDEQGNQLALNIVADPRMPPGHVYALPPWSYFPVSGQRVMVQGLGYEEEDHRVTMPVSEELTTELEGWRCWQWLLPPAANWHVRHEYAERGRAIPRTGLPLLKSWFTDHVWPGPMLRTDVSPLDHDRRGVHAFKTRRQARRHAADWDELSSVIGRVALSGIVCCHQRGYRAQVAVIQELHVQQTWATYVGEAALAALSGFYQCPVLVKPDSSRKMEQLLKYWPKLAEDWLDPTLDPVIG